ncbi:MAG: thermonuclease family protein [Pseudomonadota bacterium]
MRIDERARVSYVFDGDTVRLADGRRLRLIGIDTPELARADETDEPLARVARTRLQELLTAGANELQLQFDSQRTDHYGRLLAHAYLNNGDNVAVQLLRQGLATALVVPPNTREADCYDAIEHAARAERRGLWALPRYRPQNSTELPPDATGFHIVRGRITAVRTPSGSTWLDLEGPLSLHIGGRDRAHFAAGYLEGLAGQEVEVRGWIRTERNGLRMNIRHPAALTGLTQADGG